MAEDDEDDQIFFYDFLRGRNDIALLPIAADGAVLFEILQRIHKHADLPDLILLDQNMPKINGLQALRMLKSNSRYAHIPVGIYSTYTDERGIQTHNQRRI